MNVTTQPPGAAARSETEVERGDFSREDARPSAPPTRLVVVTYNIRYAVGSRLISGGLLRRFGVSRPSRRPALVGGNIEAAARAFS
ncbi:MAG TPA: hypothetical protein VE642_02165, partial [Pyrinomonadaceae bacterium]|nr:hypothetical protein [Pyrinomonadaceae bacterium]